MVDAFQPAPRRRPHRTRAVVVLAIAALAVAVNVVLLLRQPPPQPATERADQTAAGVRDGDAPDPAEVNGPGRNRPGALMETSIEANGDVVVRESLLFAAPTRILTLRPPMLVDSRVARAPVAELAISTDRGAVEGPSGALGTAWSTPLPAGTRRVELRYRLADAAVLSEPAPPGRALVRLVPLAYPSLAEVPVVVEVGGASVRNLVCSRLEVTRRLCGRRDGPLWRTARLIGPDAVVEVQVDLGR